MRDCDSSAISGSSFPVIVQDGDFLRHCESLSRKDSVGKILMDPQTSLNDLSSMYRDSFEYSDEKIVATCTVSKDHHIQVNPISKFGEALFLQRGTIRA